MFDKPGSRIFTILLLLIASAVLLRTTGYVFLSFCLLIAALINVWRWYLVTERPEDEMTNKLISCCHYLGNEDKTD